ncbi:hypothetical protein GLAREA_03176 [Glarea lozoyensis ATCC 20868]|uniref:Heterokaryon incompatibility domain-containing protein n=1 Tax=Glarea lozoyensis (strain ATCC 20868 / MF5171) TaxID=1116229 RepID=S3D5B7_GLAL2|nr:uncharacterized protein GLAREA_03176 [Glarea lozoyensis ATCC 20868]EPE27261.1 hypothetical protein GLAREA_03176 [Glarea lozoyensis ATCC 20868]
MANLGESGVSLPELSTDHKSYRGIVLCRYCAPLRNVKTLLESQPPRNGIGHYWTYAAIKESADGGCRLCQVILDPNNHRYSPPADIETWEEMEYKIGFYRDEFGGGSNMLMVTWYRTEERCAGIAPCPSLIFYLRLFTAADDPLAEVYLSRPLHRATSSDSCFGMVETWIDRCRNEHESCVWPDSGPLPTRVIDVGLTNDATPYLLISNGNIGHWATLSYSWGSQLPFKTTLDNLEERKTGFPPDQLSPLFGDVIKLVRRLKIRYLWIDALCIVQDSTDDWSRESSKMHQIYAEACINITAACSTGSSDGLFATDLISGSAREFYRTVSSYYAPRPNLGADQGLQNSISQPMRYWYDGINRFRGRHITYGQDRLPAIAGVAKRVQQRTRYTYKAGLWLEDIHRGLLWKTTTSSQRCPTTRAPSWSWASMTGCLTSELFDPPLWVYAEGYQATIDDIKVKCNADDPFSFVTSASLTLTSLCQIVPRSEYSISLEKRLQFNIELDDPSVALQNDLLCVHIAMFRLCWPDEDAAIHALLLEGTGVENEYTRIGLAMIPEYADNEGDWSTRTVTIV